MVRRVTGRHNIPSAPHMLPLPAPQADRLAPVVMPPARVSRNPAVMVRSESIVTVRGLSVPLAFPVHSPNVIKVEVKRSGRVRRAKLYYLRDRVGKATRLQERRTGPKSNDKE